MKFNKKSFALYLMVLFSINLSFTQTDQDTSNSNSVQNISDKQLKKWVAKLSLTENQAKQLAAINETYALKIKSEQVATWEKNIIEATIMNLRKEKKEAIKGILNKDQLATFQLLEAKENEHKNIDIVKPSNDEPLENLSSPTTSDKKRLEKMKKRLSLTETQVTQIVVINADYAAVMKALKDAAVGEDGPDKSAVKAVKALKETAINQVLTVEQLEIREHLKAKKK